MAAFPSSATAQTADEYADEWTEARRGDRDWMQRATEQLTMGPLDRMFGPPAEGAMKEVVNRIITKIEAMYEVRRDPCLAAAVNMAHYQTLATGRQEVMRGATEMLFSAAGGAAGGGEIREFLGRQLYEQIKEKLTEQALDRFKSEMRDAMKRGLPVHFEDDDSRGPCRTEFRVIWDKAAERYDFLFAGDCECNLVSCGKQGGQVPLRRWTITGWGTVIPEIEQLANGDKKVTWMIGQVQDAAITADCCGQGDRRFRSDPRTAGNEWVGAAPTPAQPQTAPPRRPQTGGTPPAGQTGTTGRAPRPTLPPRVDIPVIPDGPLTDAQLEELEQRVFDAEQLAQSEHRAAVTRASELQRNNASAEEIAAAQAAEAAALETYRRARAAREALQDKVNQQQPQEQSSSVPPERLDHASAAILAIHNRERAAVGVRPLQWDPRLAANASAYAQRLASGMSYEHASRTGRETERENLSMGLRGYSAVHMMGNWLNEKRNFKFGIFPDVSRTGDWRDAGHYSQMIWSTTTRVGCGTAQGRQYAYLVCRYSPPGNTDGKPVIAQDSGVAPPNSSTPILPRDIPKLPMGGGMTQIDPPPPPPPTARDDAPEGKEENHPLVRYGVEADARHAAETDCGNTAMARLELEKMRYALDELKKRLNAARKAGPFSAVRPEDVQRQIDEMERRVREAEQRRPRPRGACPTPPPPPPPPPSERGL